MNVASWLDNEEGVMHFIDAVGANNKKRLRYRVMTWLGKLTDVQPPSDWMEASVSGQLDPRRTFSSSDGQIVDGVSLDVVQCDASRMAETLVTIIQRDRERQLWRTIDFDGIPPSATLSKNSFDM